MVSEKWREIGIEVRRIIIFILPLMFTGILQLLYNAADSVIVGFFEGSTALAAVTSTGSLVNLTVNLFMGLTIGAGVTVAHDYGAKNHEGIRKTLHTSVCLGLICGIIISVIGLFFSRTFLEWMKSPSDVIDLSSTYLSIYFLGSPAMLCYNFCATVLRSVGDTKHPLIFLSISGVTNVALNVFFIVVIGMGVSGVAWATVISQYISLILIVIHMIRQTDCTHIDIKKLGVDYKKLKEIIRIGVPAGLQSMVFSVSNVIIQSSINSFGSLVMAGSGASASLEGFTYIAMNSVYNATVTFVGHSVGSREYKRINRIFAITLIMVTVIGIVFGWLTFAFGEELLAIYLPDDPLAIPYGMTRMSYIILTYFLCGIMEVIVGGVRGMGMSVIPMLNAIFGTCVFRVLWIMIVFAAYPSLEVIFISYPISWILTSIAHLICYFVKLRNIKKISYVTEI